MKITLSVEINANGKHSIKLVTLGNEDNTIVASEYFFCPFLSISLIAGQSPRAVLHSPDEAPLKPEPGTFYHIRLNNDEDIALPGNKTKTYDLSVYDDFSIVATNPKKEYYKITWAKLIWIEQ